MNPVFYLVDSFSDKPFNGNPAGVCLLRKPVPPSTMQKIAAEINVSETAFICPQGSLFGLRWFTPTQEVELCGHGTLAAAHILFETSLVNKDVSIQFRTLSGILMARKAKDGIELDFPKLTKEPFEDPHATLEKILGTKPKAAWKSDKHLFVELAREQDVKEFVPDFKRIAKLDAQSLSISAPSKEADIDFVSRVFAPKEGINEDPVTGAAHCSLAPHYAKLLGKNKLKAFQCSKRGGVITMQISDERIALTGNATTVMEGRLAAEALRD